MKTLSVTQAARQFQKVVASVERTQKEVVFTRYSKPIARLVPEVPAQNALEIFDDLYCKPTKKFKHSSRSER